MEIDPVSGHVGIGTYNTFGPTAPPNILTVAQGRGTVLADGYSTYSSVRWKTDIHRLTGALDRVNRLTGVSYVEKASGRHTIGVIAEDVGKVVPELVTFEEDGTTARSVDYGRLTALLIEAVKEQQETIRWLRTEIEILKAQSQRD
jgi:hypothetical protein